MLFQIKEILDHAKMELALPDLFAEKKRAAWKSVSKAEARCDFAPDRWRLNSRGILFLSVWKASIYGMTLSDIKADGSMPEFFAKNISDFLSRFFNISKNSDSSDSSAVSTYSSFQNPNSSWSIITPPPRRHLENNFATRCAKLFSQYTGIRFVEGVAKAKSRQRVMAEFELLRIPEADNIICFDDIVTTGSTFQAMDRLLRPLNKNIIYLAAINNKL